MAQLKLDTNSHMLDVDFSEPSTEIKDRFLTLAYHLGLLRDAVPINLFRMRPHPSGPVGTYQFRVETVDGRVWESSIAIPPTGEATVTFSGITGAWTAPEFSPIVPLRIFASSLFKDDNVTHVLATWQ